MATYRATSWLHLTLFACLFGAMYGMTNSSQANPAGFGKAWVRDNPFVIHGFNIGNEHGQQFGEALFRGAGLNTQSWPDDTIGGPIHYWREWSVLDTGTLNNIAYERAQWGDQVTAWIITSEAPIGSYASIRTVMDHMETLDPDKPVYADVHWSYTNPNPIYDAERTAVNTVLNPDILLNPNYPFRVDGVDRFYDHAEGGSLAHMMKLREQGQAANKPYFLVLQGFSYTSSGVPAIDHRLPNETELRAQVYAYLTGGTKGFSWFQYETNQLDEGLISNGGVPSPTYAIAAELNPEIKVMGETLRLLDSADVRIVLGKHLNGGVNDNPLPQAMTSWSAGAGGDPHLVSITPTSTVLPASPQRSADLLAGFFQDDSNEPYFMLTNLMHGQSLVEADTAATFEVEFDATIDQIYRLDPQTGAIETINLTNHKFIYDEFGGNGQLYNYSGVFLNPIRTWTSDASGDWDDGTRWEDALIPNHNERTAVFGSAITSPQLIFTNSAVTVKNVTFDNANTYAIAGAGSVTLDAATVSAGVNVLQGTHEFQIAVNLGTTTTVDVASGGSLAFKNALNLNGNTLTKTGLGDLLISNSQGSGGGSIVVTAGTLGGSGTVGGDLTNSNSTVAPGNSAGTLSVSGNYLQTAGTLAIEIGGLLGGEFDVLDIAGTATLGGILDISLLSFAPSPDDSFTVLSAALGITDNGMTLTGDMANDFSLTLQSGSTDLVLTFQASSLLGDFDLDNDVDGADFLLWQRGGSPSPLSSTDLADWQANYGSTLLSLASAASVPEPATGGLLVVAWGMLTLWGTRRKEPSRLVREAGPGARVCSRNARLGQTRTMVWGIVLSLALGVVATTSQAAVFFEHIGDLDPDADEGFTRSNGTPLNNFGNPASAGEPANWQITSSGSYKDDLGASGDMTLSDIDDVFSDPNGWTYTINMKTNFAETPYLAATHLSDTSCSCGPGNRRFDLTMISASVKNEPGRGQGLYYLAPPGPPGGTWVQLGTVDPTDGFHTYQIVLNPNGGDPADDEVLYYIDGLLEATVPITGVNSSESPTNSWGQASGSDGAGSSDSQWSLVRLETGQHPIAPNYGRTWNDMDSGDWLGENWYRTNGFAPGDAPDSNLSTATFGDAILAPQTVYANSAVTATGLTFGDSNPGTIQQPYAIAGLGSVNLDSVATSSTIDVLEGSHQFQVDVNLNDATDVDVASGASLAFNGTLHLGGNLLTKTGAGTMDINGTLIPAGGSVMLAAGALGGSGQIIGDLHNTGGAVTPGNSPGELTVTGDYTHGPGATLAIQLAGLVQGSNYDLLDVSGTVTLNGGLLDVVLLDGFQPAEGDVFDILDANAILGDGFGSLSLPGLAEGLAWDTSNLTSGGSLSVSTVPEPSAIMLVLSSTWCACGLARRKQIK